MVTVSDLPVLTLTNELFDLTFSPSPAKEWGIERATAWAAGGHL